MPYANVKCKLCGGDGWITCIQCGGKGYGSAPCGFEGCISGMVQTNWGPVECTKCHGTGFQICGTCEGVKQGHTTTGYKCINCSGSGTIAEWIEEGQATA